MVHMHVMMQQSLLEVNWEVAVEAKRVARVRVVRNLAPALLVALEEKREAPYTLLLIVPPLVVRREARRVDRPR
jgi:hypothetical protein